MNFTGKRKKKKRNTKIKREREMKCNHGNIKLQNLNGWNQMEPDLKTFLQVSSFNENK